MIGPAHHHVVSIGLAADVFTSSCLTRCVLFGSKKQKRLLHWNGPNIRVHAGIGRAVQVGAGQNPGFLLRGECGGRSAHRVTHDSNLGQVQVAMPKTIMRIHFLELVENESDVCHQDLVRELTDGHSLSSSIGFSGPVGREFEFMPVRENRNQGVRGMIGGDHDEAAAGQTLRQNCVDGGHDTRSVFEKNNWKRAALSQGCLQSSVGEHEALEIRLQFPLLGQRIRSLLVHVGRKCGRTLHCRIPHRNQQIPAAARVSQDNRSSAYGMAAIGPRKIKFCLVRSRGSRGQTEQDQHENGKDTE